MSEGPIPPSNIGFELCLPNLTSKSPKYAIKQLLVRFPSPEWLETDTLVSNAEKVVTETIVVFDCPNSHSQVLNRAPASLPR